MNSTIDPTTAVYYPQPGPQTEYHRRIEDVVGYGGTKGPGKTHALLGEATRQTGNPHYHGILFRRTYPQLQEIIDRGTKMYARLGAQWKGDLHRWHFPSGAIVSTGHVQHEKDVENWNGKEFQFMGVDQAEQFTKHMIDFLMAQNRTSIDGLRCAFHMTFNPGGIGNAWLKNMFIKGKTPGETYKMVLALPGGIEVSRTYTFIRGTVYDNKILLKNNPQYLAVLASLPDRLKKAFLLGDFDALSGQYFDTWMEDLHVIEPFEIPKEWEIYMSMDWGYENPLSVHWWAVPPAGKHVYCIAEYKVDHKTSTVAAQEIHELNKKMFGDHYIRDRRVRWWAVDPSIFNTGGQTGKSIGDDFVAVMREKGDDGRDERLQIIPADNSRINGWNVFRNMLAVQPDGKPYCMWFKTCTYAIESIPTLIHDEHKPEDVDSDGDDHAADDHRYFFIERFGPKKIVPRKPYDHLQETSPESYAEWKRADEKIFNRNKKNDLRKAREFSQVGS